MSKPWDNRVWELAAEIAMSVDDSWCSWVMKDNCNVYWSIATQRRNTDGSRVWVTLGSTTVENLELIVTINRASRDRMLKRLVKRLNDVKHVLVPDIPR